MGVAWRYTPPKVNALPVLHAAGEAAVQRAAEVILEASQRLVPVESGALRDSGRISQDGLEAAISYGDPGEETADYAVVQHERMDYHHPNGGQAKYLEQPMHAEADRVGEILAATVRGVLG